MGNSDVQSLKIDEVIVLRKFDGNSTRPEDEVERITVQNGTIIGHDNIENGEVIGPVEDNHVGKNIGRLFPDENTKGVE